MPSAPKHVLGLPEVTADDAAKLLECGDRGSGETHLGCVNPAGVRASFPPRSLPTPAFMIGYSDQNSGREQLPNGPSTP